MNLISVKKATQKGELPISINTAYKWHSTKRYPALLIKVGNKLFIDREEWERMAEQARDKQVNEAKRIRADLT